LTQLPLLLVGGGGSAPTSLPASLLSAAVGGNDVAKLPATAATTSIIASSEVLAKSAWLFNIRRISVETVALKLSPKPTHQYIKLR
jgi:hypothetical protein